MKAKSLQPKSHYHFRLKNSVTKHIVLTPNSVYLYIYTNQNIFLAKKSLLMAFHIMHSIIPYERNRNKNEKLYRLLTQS